MYILAPSILAADFGNLRKEIETVSEAGAQYIHIDVMDGMFVPSISFGMPVIQSVRSCTDKVFDVHMMVEEPGRYAADLKAAGADLLCVHQEATPVETLSCVLDQVDMILLMSVNPGFGGQKFIPYTVDKIRKLRAMLNERGLQTDIQVDGGVGLGNVKELMEAGANIFVAGSAVYKNDAAANVKAFLKIFEEAENR